MKTDYFGDREFDILLTLLHPFDTTFPAIQIHADRLLYELADALSNGGEDWCPIERAEKILFFTWRKLYVKTFRLHLRVLPLVHRAKTAADAKHRGVRVGGRHHGRSVLLN